MKIEQAGLTYSRIPEHVQRQPAQHQAESVKEQNPIQVNNDSFIKSSPAASTPDLKAPVSQPLSKYLNLAEKEMLSNLFPQKQTAYGIGAYNNVRQPVLDTAAKGNRIDMTF